MTVNVLGYENAHFSFQDGRQVDGMYLYLREDDPGRIKNVVGMKTERVFLSAARLDSCKYSPKVGDNIRVYYNRYGKVDSVQKIS